MTQARCRMLAFLALGFAAISAMGCAKKPRTGPPDVILITVDTLRPDHLGAYGNERARTPQIDALASSGALYTNAFAPMGRTTPSIASMMTGLWPHEHGCREVRTPVLHGTLLASVFEEAGYATIGITANPSCCPQRRARQGLRGLRPGRR